MSYSTGWLRRYGEITFFWVWHTSVIIHCPSYSLIKPLHIPLNPHLYLVFDNILYMFAVSQNAMYYVLHELLYYGSMQLCRRRSISTIFLWPFLFSYCSGIFPGSALKESSLAPYSFYLIWQSPANTITCSSSLYTITPAWFTWDLGSSDPSSPWYSPFIMSQLSSRTWTGQIPSRDNCRLFSMTFTVLL